MAGVSLMEGHQNGREVEETQLAAHRIEPVVEASTKRKIRELRTGISVTTISVRMDGIDNMLRIVWGTENHRTLSSCSKPRDPGVLQKCLVSSTKSRISLLDPSLAASSCIPAPK